MINFQVHELDLFLQWAEFFPFSPFRVFTLKLNTRKDEKT
jgi:hypothetical protein